LGSVVWLECTLRWGVGGGRKTSGERGGSINASIEPNRSIQSQAKSRRGTQSPKKGKEQQQQQTNGTKTRSIKSPCTAIPSVHRAHSKSSCCFRARVSVGGSDFAGMMIVGYTFEPPASTWPIRWPEAPLSSRSVQGYLLDFSERQTINCKFGLVIQVLDGHQFVKPAAARALLFEGV
jgi:hypothetical protein